MSQVFAQWIMYTVTFLVSQLNTPEPTRSVAAFKECT